MSVIDSRLNYNRELLSTQGNGNRARRVLELLCHITARHLVLFARIIELPPMRLYDPLWLFVPLLPDSDRRSRRHFSCLTVSESSVYLLCETFIRHFRPGKLRREENDKRLIMLKLNFWEIFRNNQDNNIKVIFKDKNYSYTLLNDRAFSLFRA